MLVVNMQDKTRQRQTKQVSWNPEMSQSQLLLYSGIVVPALIYCSLLTHVFYHLHRHQPHPPPDLVWSRSTEVDRRVELIESRSGPLLAYK